MKEISSQKSFFSTTTVLIYLAIIKFFLHFFVNLNGRYGLHRDEFYYLACADHLAFGFVDHPPLSIIFLAVNRFLLGDSILALRLLPALAGAGMVFITGLIIRELGGKRFAQILGALSVIAVPTYLFNHTVYSMNAFDQLFWSILIFISIKIIKYENKKLWIWFGIVAGLGMQNKISIIFLVCGLIVAFLVTSNRKYLFNKYFIISSIVAAVIFLPHIIWQIKFGWPTLEFINNAKKYKIAAFTPWEFFLAQIDMLNQFLFPLWIGGLIYFFTGKPVKKYRVFGVLYIVIFVFFVLQKSKPYYLMPMYSVLLASGAILFENLIIKLRSSWLKPVLLVYIILIGLQSAPFTLPLLSEKTYIKYAAFWGDEQKAEENHEMGILPQRFADMHGWENMVATIARVYHTLSLEEKLKAAILVNNYGEAGAIDYYREKYELPRAICGHNSYWHWGPRGASGEIIIRLGGSKEDYQESYKDVKQMDMVRCTYCMPYENNLPVFICRGLYKPLIEVWPQVKHYD